MAIVVFSDVVLPNSVIAAGVRGRQIRNNNRVIGQNGNEQINVNWARTLRQYDLGVVPLSVSQWQTIEGLHEVTEGGAFGFLLSDPKDHNAGTNGRVQLVSGTTYQLTKSYTAAGSSRTKTRSITRPNPANFVLSVSGVPTTAYTLTASTGRLVIPAAPAATNVTWTGDFWVPVHFASDEIDWELVVSGPDEGRFLAGPLVSLMEVRE